MLRTENNTPLSRETWKQKWNGKRQTELSLESDTQAKWGQEGGLADEMIGNYWIWFNSDRDFAWIEMM